MLKRRDFLSSAAQIAGLAAVASVFPSLARSQERRRGGGAATGATAGAPKELSFPMMEPGKGVAAAVSYEVDKKKVKKDLQTDRQGVKFADQHCSNCGFYKKVGTKDGKEVGTCQIFANNLVAGPAWCSSWNKRA